MSVGTECFWIMTGKNSRAERHDAMEEHMYSLYRKPSGSIRAGLKLFYHGVDGKGDKNTSHL